MAKLMRGIIFPGNKMVEIREFAVPEPGPDEVVVKIKASALCRSDLSIYYGNPVVGGTVEQGSIIPGHEPAGVVASLGAGVKSLKEGDRVAIYLALGCGICEQCVTGYSMMCKEFKCIGFDVHGGHAEYIKVPAKNCLLIPKDMSMVTAAVSTDALGTLYHAIKRLGLSGRDITAVFGIGPMGASGILMAKASGATVVAVDVEDSRLQLAKELGADYTINSLNVDLFEELRSITSGRMLDAAVDCSGNPHAEKSALDMIRPQGKAVFIGENSNLEIHPSKQFIRKQISLIGSWYFPIWEYQEIADFIMEKKIPAEKIVSHKYKLEGAEEAYTLFDSRKTQKVVFTF